MAPGRKRGAKGAKSKSELSLGDLVLAKVKGFPAWPAKIARPEDWEQIPDPKKYFVVFFGTKEIAFVAPVDIQAFTVEAKNKLSTRCKKGKTVKYFAQAVKEICEAFEEFQTKSSSGMKDDTDSLDFGSDAPSVNGMVDDAVMVGLEDVNPGDGPSLDDHGCGLERCSQRQEDEASGGTISGEEDSSSPVLSPVHAKYHEKKEITNGHKSKKTTTDSKGQSEGDVQTPKIMGSNTATSLVRDENLKDGLHNKTSNDGLKDISPESLRSELDVLSGNKTQQSVKGKINVKAVHENQKDVEGSFKEQEKDELSGRKSRLQLGHRKHHFLTDEVSHLVKRSKSVDATFDSPKQSLQINRKSGVPGNKAGSVELKRSIVRGNSGNRLASRATKGSFDSRVSGEEDVLPPTKRRRQALEVMSGSSTITSDEKRGKGSVALRRDLLCSDKVKSPATQFPLKRRAVHLYDDEDDEEPKTPIHGGSLRKVDAPSCLSDSAQIAGVHSQHSTNDQVTGGLEDGSSKVVVSTSKLVTQVFSTSPHQHVEKPKKAVAAHVSRSPGKMVLDKLSPKEVEPALVALKRTTLLDAADKLVVEPYKANKTLVKVSGNVSQRRSQVGSNKNAGVVFDSLNDSPNQRTNERSKAVVSGEGQKNDSKSSSRITDSVVVAGKLTETNPLPVERLEKEKEAGREDKTSLLTDSKIEDSAMSMKHLIAVAQAKRREALSQSVFLGNSSNDVPGGSPNLVSPFQHIVSGSSNMMQPDMQGYLTHTSLGSPTSHIHQLPLNNHPEIEEYEDRRVSSGQHDARGSLSGGTDAAVARDALEGMIETLSRTKESIGRATRLAIDCAKYGIASEVVELLICKLESEPSLHRKVDLFFLVDSITQCSHSHKGIAGASYIPTVQAALPRLLGAAAPPGAGARENRRQCLKVLRLWLERKILPDSLLRRYMEDIGVPNEDASAGFFLRRPSRAERAIDDPIREMEGMLVDEYGSNATFHLPGFLSSRVFEEEDEDEEREEQEVLRISCKADDDRSLMDMSCNTGEAEMCMITPNDRRHCILEDVDGELEMEDVSGNLKDGRPLFTGASYEIGSHGQGSNRNLEAASDSFTKLPEGSPPLPLDSPPSTPPLPSSPPPMLPPPPSLPSTPPPLPPSLPSTPPPPPLPPLPLQAHPYPPPAGMPPNLVPHLSLTPQPSIVSQNIHPFQSILPSSSQKLAYQPPVPPEYCGAPSGNQLVQVAGNTPHGARIDVNIRNDMFPQQSTCFVSSGLCNSREPAGYNSARPLDYGHSGMYTNTQIPLMNQQFQPGNIPSAQRPFHPAPPPQATSSHFSYSKPTVQQQPQHPYPPPYSLPNHPDGPRQYTIDDKWRMSSNEVNTNSQHGLWINGGRNSLNLVPPFTQEGYFRPPFERPPINNDGFQPTAINTHPAPIPGHGITRSDISSLSCWRPA